MGAGSPIETRQVAQHSARCSSTQPELRGWQSGQCCADPNATSAVSNSHKSSSSNSEISERTNTAKNSVPYQRKRSADDNGCWTNGQSAATRVQWRLTGRTGSPREGGVQTPTLQNQLSFFRFFLNIASNNKSLALNCSGLRGT